MERGTYCKWLGRVSLRYMGVCKFGAHRAWHRAANQESHSPADISLLASTRPKRHFLREIHFMRVNHGILKRQILLFLNQSTILIQIEPTQSACFKSTKAKFHTYIIHNIHNIQYAIHNTRYTQNTIYYTINTIYVQYTSDVIQSSKGLVTQSGQPLTQPCISPY